MGYSYDMRGEGQGFDLQEGEYEFIVISFRDEVSKKGNQMHVATLEEVKSGQVDDVYLVAEKGKRWFLKQFLAACSILPDSDGNVHFEQSDVLNKTIIGVIEREKETFIDRNNVEQEVEKSKIKKFLPSEPKTQASSENVPF